jgi:mono/diheme cytochrome c family protein
MKNFMAFALVVIVVLAGAATYADAEPMQNGKNSEGQKIYKQYCVTCHGLYGDMGTNGAFDLTKSVLKLDERVNVITNGRNVMTSFKALLDKNKIKEVAKYTMTLKK